MTAVLLSTPEKHRDFAAAREVLHSEYATPDQLSMACDVLAESHNWQDILLVRNVRQSLWSGIQSALICEPPTRDLGQNAALFAALNARRNYRHAWILAAVTLAAVLGLAVL